MFALDQEGTADGGEGLTVSGQFGSITIGNPSSAIDAVDDKTEILEIMDPLSGNADSTVLWKLPTFAEGLSVYASYAPTDGDSRTALTGDEGGITAVDDNESDGDSALDEAGVSIAYQMGPVRFAYGQNDEAAEENTFAGLQYSANGVMVAYEQNEKDVTGTKTDYTSFAAMYTMGDLSLRGLTTTQKSGGTTAKDRTAYGLHYNLGGGATLVIEAGSEDKATSKGEFSAVGVMYSF